MDDLTVGRLAFGPQGVAQPATVDDLLAETFFDASVPFHGRLKTFRLRKLDLPTMLWEGVITQPLMQAADRFSQLHAIYLAAGGETGGPQADATVMAQMTDDDRDKMLGLLHRYAVAACLQPQLTASVPPEPKRFPVQHLPLATLFAIFQAQPPNEPPRVSEAAASEFRPTESPDAGGPGPDGAAVQPAAELVAAGDSVGS